MWWLQVSVAPCPLMRGYRGNMTVTLTTRTSTVIDCSLRRPPAGGRRSRAPGEGLSSNIGGSRLARLQPSLRRTVDSSVLLKSTVKGVLSGRKSSETCSSDEMTTSDESRKRGLLAIMNNGGLKSHTRRFVGESDHGARPRVASQLFLAPLDPAISIPGIFLGCHSEGQKCSGRHISTSTHHNCSAVNAKKQLENSRRHNFVAKIEKPLAKFLRRTSVGGNPLEPT